jgi:GNAT superfamily N-acetyltransferase
VLTIAHAEETDVPALAVLLEEVDRFYGAREFEPLSRREKKIRDALFGLRPTAYALLARDRDELVGLASYSFLWPAADLTSSLFLKELYVRRDRQRQGVGRRLMQALCAVAVRTGCSRVEWQTEDDNEQAMAFYRSLGDPVLRGKVFYRLRGEGLPSLAGE